MHRPHRRPSRRSGRGPHRVTTAVLLATTLVVGACSGGEEAEPEPSESPTPSPSPTFDVRPVIGERIATSQSLSTGDNLGLDDAVPADETAINAAIDTVGDLLDAHLDTLQRDGVGTLDDFAADGLLDEGDPAPVTTDLTSPELPVAEAHYTITAYHEGTPQWLTARVEVTRVDDSVALATMTFYVTQAGDPVLTFFGPEDPVTEEEA